MRSVAEYLAKAEEFGGLALKTSNAALKKRYADLAECYRMLARERENLINDGVIDSDGR
jgi:hypothetical protein